MQHHAVAKLQRIVLLPFSPPLACTVWDLWPRGCLCIVLHLHLPLSLDPRLLLRLIPPQAWHRVLRILSSMNAPHPQQSTAWMAMMKCAQHATVCEECHHHCCLLARPCCQCAADSRHHRRHRPSQNAGSRRVNPIIFGRRESSKKKKHVKKTSKIAFRQLYEPNHSEEGAKSIGANFSGCTLFGAASG